jgi:hypothetical protein
MVVFSCWVKAHWVERYYYAHGGINGFLKIGDSYFKLAVPLIFQGG